MKTNEYNELREQTGYVVNYDNVGYLPDSTSYTSTMDIDSFNEIYGGYIDTNRVIDKLNSTNGPLRTGPGLRQLLMDSKPEDFINYYQYPTSPKECYSRNNQYPSIADVIPNGDYDRICTTDDVKELLDKYGEILEKGISDNDSDISKRYDEMINDYVKQYLTDLTKIFK